MPYQWKEPSKPPSKQKKERKKPPSSKEKRQPILPILPAAILPDLPRRYRTRSVTRQQSQELPLVSPPASPEPSHRYPTRSTTRKQPRERLSKPSPPPPSQVITFSYPRESPSFHRKSLKRKREGSVDSCVEVAALLTGHDEREIVLNSRKAELAEKVAVVARKEEEMNQLAGIIKGQRATDTMKVLEDLCTC